ncbi:epidermal growth factor receptor kinase substrate 8-like protein 3 isoform X2 [Dendropsophus ebraccatus]|uniref:epidermal growth factor receptor kinase substrate 8-like protein 3 isoform X2 n=1 Tax=Dendropsophus ebraccatus TaxID=150705 RepID=UPI0038315B07
MLNMDQDVVNAIEGVLAHQVETIKSSNVGSRPSAKSIYNQRKQYAQSLSRSNSNFYHRVEHLLTCELDDRLQNAQDCVSHLQALDAEGKVWGQEMILQVENGQLILTDLESQDSLESIPLQYIESYDSVLGTHPYKSLLAVTARSPESPSILLFQCDEHPANVLQRNLQKTLMQWKEAQHKRDSIRNKLQSALTQNKFSEQNYHPQPMDSPKLSRSGGQTPQDSPVYQRRRDPSSISFQPPPVPISPPHKAGAGRDIEILNHVLADIEMFVGKLNLQKKKKKDKSSIPESEFIECLQKIKYSFNLMAKAQEQMYQPTAPELVHILMDILPTILSKCPGKNTASAVLSPFLTQRAILLLSSCVTEKERKLWESLGDPWLRTREDSPNGRSVPPYIPTFSDGWSPPASVPSNGQPQSEVQQSSKTPPINRHVQPVEMKVAYDFDARNQQELSVKKGDSVKVLDQSRQWWMVENVRQQRGFVPSNILESTDYNQQVPLQAETRLQQSSTPREVTEWLESSGFSRITVKCLGVLSGDQLLELSREDLKAVCPEEGGRVYSQLNEIRASLMM